MYMALEIEKAENEAKQKKVDMWISHLSRIFSQAPQGEESSKARRARESFTNMIRPEPDTKAIPKPRSWDKEVELALQQAQAEKGVIINGDST